MLANELAEGNTYKRSLKIRLTIQIVVVLWGILAIAISVVVADAHTVTSLQNAGIPLHMLSASMQGFYTGFGGGFTAGAVVALLYTLYLLLNKKAQQRRKVRALDERNVMINRKAASMTTAITIVLAGFATIIAGVFNSTVMFTLITLIFFMAAVYLVSFFVYRARS